MNATIAYHTPHTAQTVAKTEKFDLPAHFCARLAADSQRNLRRALLAMEVSKLQCYPFQPDQQVQRMDWELYVAEIASDILQEQTPKRLLQVPGDAERAMQHGEAL